MEARRKGVEGRMVVTRNRRSNSGRSSRAKPCEGCVGWRARWFEEAPFPSRFRFQNGPRRQGFAAPRPHRAPLTSPGRSERVLR